MLLSVQNYTNLLSTRLTNLTITQRRDQTETVRDSYAYGEDNLDMAGSSTPAVFLLRYELKKMRSVRERKCGL
jgi:hypothetical protein